MASPLWMQGRQVPGAGIKSASFKSQEAAVSVRRTVIYLHGFGDTSNGAQSPVKHALTELLADEDTVDLRCETYHPGGDVNATRYENFLAKLQELVQKLAMTGKVHLVGYSVGAYLAAVFAARHPSLVESALLIAPAIDNFERNWKKDQTSCPHGQEFIRQLKSLPARPSMDTAQVPTTIVHGLGEDDDGGSDPQRVRDWTQVLQAAPGSNVRLHTPDTDHSLGGWLHSEGMLTLDRGHSEDSGKHSMRMLVSGLLQLEKRTPMFVYGTLMSCEVNHHKLHSSVTTTGSTGVAPVCIGRGKTKEPFAMFVLGAGEGGHMGGRGIPFVHPAATPGTPIHGEVWAIAPHTLAAIDDFQSCPDWYTKLSTPVCLENGDLVMAEMYVNQYMDETQSGAFLPAARLLSGDFRQSCPSPKKEANITGTQAAAKNLSR